MNVWGGEHSGAGNAPRYHHSIISIYITEPFSFSFLYFFFFLLLTKSDFSLSCFLSPYLSSLIGLSPASRTTCEHQHRQKKKAIARDSYFTVTPVCNKCQGSKSFNSYSVVLRNCISPQKQQECSYEEASSQHTAEINHILCQCCKLKVE